MDKTFNKFSHLNSIFENMLNFCWDDEIRIGKNTKKKWAFSQNEESLIFRGVASIFEILWKNLDVQYCIIRNNKYAAYKRRKIRCLEVKTHKYCVTCWEHHIVGHEPRGRFDGSMRIVHSTLVILILYIYTFLYFNGMLYKSYMLTFYIMLCIWNGN